jgi:multicomponent Na+:H+ antiporter subunit A
MTHIAGYGLLAACLIVFFRTGTVLWTDPAVAHTFTFGIFLLMLVAVLAKSVQVLCTLGFPRLWRRPPL